MAFIERFVYSGGGAKGVTNIGMYLALKDLGLLTDVQEISGASAGAITAAFVAIGMDPKDFRAQLLKTNFKTLLGPRVGSVFATNSPGTSSLTRDGVPLEKFIRTNINETIKKHFDSPSIKEKVAEVPQFQQILNKFSQENPRVTFADLACLHQYFPKLFKKLVITAVEFPNGNLQVFSDESTPDVEIALACRASASIPVVLQPTPIEINNETRLFVDGGLYDNLPTDFFDRDEEGKYVKNKKANQTLVFAFGEGEDNAKNQIFQALYGTRYDESIDDNQMLFMSENFTPLLDIYLKKEKINFKKKTGLIKDNIRKIYQEINAKYDTNEEEIDFLIRVYKNVFLDLIKHANENQNFWDEYKAVKGKKHRSEILIRFVKSTLRPVLYNANWIEQLKRDVLTQLLGDLQSPYKNTAQKEIGYQKLRSEYALRVIELRVGRLKTTDFLEAERLARVMAALGYLDTVGYLSNHDLYDAGFFNPEKFYGALIHCFETIYQALLAGNNSDPTTNILFKTITLLHNAKDRQKSLIDRQIYHEIKASVEKNPDSAAAFALTRAVEFLTENLVAEQLFKEVYCAEKTGKRFPFFGSSGSKSYKSVEPEACQSMFDLYALETEMLAKSKMRVIFTLLRRMERFNVAYEQALRERDENDPFAEERVKITCSR